MPDSYLGLLGDAPTVVLSETDENDSDLGLPVTTWAMRGLTVHTWALGVKCYPACHK